MNKIIDLLRLFEFKEKIISLIPTKVSELNNDLEYVKKTEINDIKKSVSDGKAEVADAITEKGIETAADATFSEMAENIGKILTSSVPMWQNTENGTYKFVQSGDRWVANNRGINGATATSTWTVTVPEATTAYIGYRTTTETADKISIKLNGNTILAATGGNMASESAVTLNLVAGENTLIATYTKDSSVHSYGDMAYVILPQIGEQPGQYKYQSKSVTPSSSSQTVYPDTGYDGLYAVTVAAASAGSDKVKTGTITFSGNNQNVDIGFKPKLLVFARSTYFIVYCPDIVDNKEIRGNLGASPTTLLQYTIGGTSAWISYVSSTYVTIKMTGSNVNKTFNWYAVG